MSTRIAKAALISIATALSFAANAGTVVFDCKSTEGRTITVGAMHSYAKTPYTVDWGDGNVVTVESGAVATNTFSRDVSRITATGVDFVGREGSEPMRPVFNDGSYDAAWRTYVDNTCTGVTLTGIQEIRCYAFLHLRSMESISIPEGVRKIGYAAFCDCESLKSIHVPSTVGIIGARSVDACDSLESVTVAPANTNFFEVEGMACVRRGSDIVAIGTTMPNGYTHTLAGGLARLPDELEGLYSCRMPIHNVSDGFNVPHALIVGEWKKHGIYYSIMPDETTEYTADVDWLDWEIYDYFAFTEHSPEIFGNPRFYPTKDTRFEMMIFDMKPGYVTYHWSHNGVDHPEATGTTFSGTSTEGTNVVELYGVTNRGKVLKTSKFKWIVDTTPPSAPVIGGTPAEGYSGTTKTYALTATASDSSGIREFYYSLDGGVLTKYSGSRFSLSGRVTNTGSHSLTIYAVDNAGNESTTSTRTWTTN